MLYFFLYFHKSKIHFINSVSFILPADKNKTLAQKVIEWKFDQLDKNKDEILKRRETRTIKRMVRKLIQPKACARMFLEYCDSDGDRMIKKKEWTYCLNTNASSSEYQYLFSFTKKKNSTMLTIILSVFRGFVCTFTKKIIKISWLIGSLLFFLSFENIMLLWMSPRCDLWWRHKIKTPFLDT